jgi:hypothetical protein
MSLDEASESETERPDQELPEEEDDVEDQQEDVSEQDLEKESEISDQDLEENETYSVECLYLEAQVSKGEQDAEQYNEQEERLVPGGFDLQENNRLDSYGVEVEESRSSELKNRFPEQSRPCVSRFNLTSFNVYVAANDAKEKEEENVESCSYVVHRASSDVCKLSVQFNQIGGKAEDDCLVVDGERFCAAAADGNLTAGALREVEFEGEELVITTTTEQVTWLRIIVQR